MNIQNIDKAIAIMERATNLNMENWQEQTVDSFKLANTIEDLHACGNTACFAGYIAISEEFEEDGGYVNGDGLPCYCDDEGVEAIATWLNVTPTIAIMFIHGSIRDSFRNNDRFTFYGKEFHTVNTNDVIEKLKELKELGEDTFAKKYFEASARYLGTPIPLEMKYVFN